MKIANIPTYTHTDMYVQMYVNIHDVCMNETPLLKIDIIYVAVTQFVMKQFKMEVVYLL